MSTLYFLDLSCNNTLLIILALGVDTPESFPYKVLSTPSTSAPPFFITQLHLTLCNVHRCTSSSMLHQALLHPPLHDFLSLHVFCRFFSRHNFFHAYIHQSGIVSCLHQQPIISSRDSMSSPHFLDMSFNTSLFLILAPRFDTPPPRVSRLKCFLLC